MQTINRRTALLGLGAMTLVSVSGVAKAASPPTIKAYRDPGCGCCSKWALGLQADGFIVEMTDDPGLASRRAKAGVPTDLAGCHMALVDTYIIEGHVPSDDIVRLLKEKPDALGIAVPGMPIGSPGMEMGDEKEPYDVVLFKADGSRAVFAKH